MQQCEGKLYAAIRATRPAHGSPPLELGEGSVVGKGVFYHKAIAHDQLVDLMRQSVALVNSSLAEGMCGSMLEVTGPVVPFRNLVLSAAAVFLCHHDLVRTGTRLCALCCAVL